MLRLVPVTGPAGTSRIVPTLRAHYGFQSTGAHFLDFASIKLDVDERPKDLFNSLQNTVRFSLMKILLV